MSYECFEDFLGALTSRKRKAIRGERKRAIEGGIDIEWVTGNDLTEAHWDAFFDFYMDTGSRKWGSPYLTRQFFSLIGETMRDEILLVFAKRDGRTIAGALNFIGADTLYGRYWGALEEHPCLHFEVCYYQAIDFAITHRLARVEAGAQGAHKLARGYLPVPTYSAHWIRDPGLRRAVADYLRRERAAVAREIALLGEESPYRRHNDLVMPAKAEHPVTTALQGLLRSPGQPGDDKECRAIAVVRNILVDLGAATTRNDSRKRQRGFVNDLRPEQRLRQGAARRAPLPTRSTRTRTRSLSSTSCRAPKATHW